MLTLAWVLLMLGAYPLWRAWQGCQRTSLAHALHWTVVAWSAWTAMLLSEEFYPVAGLKTVRYLAVCLTACAAVAVLGARRPGVAAWNFVVAGLLAVLLLPVAQGLGEPRLGLANTLFLAGLLVLGVLNYLPTTLGLVAVLLGTGSGVELWDLASEGQSEMAVQALPVGRILVAISPLIAMVQMETRTAPDAEFDRIWRDFRDRYGLVWGRRVQEQFSTAAQNAGWPVVLRWGGIRLKPGASMPDMPVQEEIVATLRALLKRFGVEPEPPQEAGEKAGSGQ